MRIGATRDSSLEELHELHQRTVPFETLDIALGERMVLDEKWALDKILRRNRGGACGELNPAFAALLRDRGHKVELLAARATRAPSWDRRTTTWPCA